MTLTIHIVAIGEKMPPWVQQGYQEYAKRVHGRCTLALREVAAERRGKNPDLGKIARLETARLKRAIPTASRVIALDRGGKPWATLEMAQRMADWMLQSAPVTLVVGGPEGLSPELLQLADERWSLSPLTFAHPLVRVILAEQLYRCYSLLEGQPYHR